MRCVRPDMSSVTLTCHYLRDGRATLRFSIKKQVWTLLAPYAVGVPRSCRPDPQGPQAVQRQGDLHQSPSR